MMTTQRKLLWIGGIVASVAAALALGVSLNTILLFGAVLLCPAAMYFGMGGTGRHQGCGHAGACKHKGASGDESAEEKEHERQRAA